MAQSHSLGALVARVFLAVLFVVAGFGKLGDVAGFSQYLASGGLPAVLAWPAVLFEILAGLAILVGLFTRPVAILVALFCLATGLLYHLVPGDSTGFMKNLALAGGYLALALTGPGAYSVDAKMGTDRTVTA